MAPISAFLDYSVIDHLHRAKNGTYLGKHAEALLDLESKAISGRIQVWMSEITEVEMIIGRENLSLAPVRLPYLLRKDADKLSIAKNLGVRWLSYPCSKFDDAYSRLDVSFRFAGPESATAEAFERLIERIPHVSPGDARQLASFVYGTEDPDRFRPVMKWFVTEDQPLRSALRSEVQRGNIPELAGINIVAVSEMAGAA